MNEDCKKWYINVGVGGGVALKMLLHFRVVDVASSSIAATSLAENIPGARTACPHTQIRLRSVLGFS